MIVERFSRFPAAFGKQAALRAGFAVQAAHRPKLPRLRRLSAAGLTLCLRLRRPVEFWLNFRERTKKNTCQRFVRQQVFGGCGGWI